MAGSVNKVLIVGNVGKDPDIRTTQDGREIANLSVATSESWKDKNGERRDRTEWHRVSVFNENIVKVVKSYVRKGSKLYIEGQLQTRKWTDNSGVERYSTEVVLQNYGGNITLLDSKRDDGAQETQDAAPAAKASLEKYPARNTEPPIYNDEIPF